MWPDAHSAACWFLALSATLIHVGNMPEQAMQLARAMKPRLTCGEKPYMAAMVTTRQSGGRDSKGTPKLGAAGGLQGAAQQAAAAGSAAYREGAVRLRKDAWDSRDAPAQERNRREGLTTDDNTRRMFP
jgi:hypothetical protein